MFNEVPQNGLSSFGVSCIITNILIKMVPDSIVSGLCSVDCFYRLLRSKRRSTVNGVLVKRTDTPESTLP